MKTAIILLIFLTYSLTIKSQEWAPVGAKWYYDITHAWSGNIEYRMLSCDSTVLFKGVMCQRIRNNHCACNNYFCENKIYMYEVDSKVFFYNPDVDTFQLLYNFNSAIGESWVISYGVLDTVVVRVDSIGSVLINGHSLRKLYVTYRYNFSGWWDHLGDHDGSYEVKSVVIEKLGDVELLINIDDPGLSVCDMDYIHHLRCYEDEEIGLYSTGIRPECRYTYVWEPDNIIQESADFKIFPNPVQDKLSIKSNLWEEISYEIYNIQGLMIQNGTTHIIDFSCLPNGVYFLRLMAQDCIIKTFKIVKHLP